MIIPLQEQLMHKIPQLPSLLCKLMAAILNLLLIIVIFQIYCQKNEFLSPKYPRIEVLVMIVALQDQFYIETNLANRSFTQFVQ